MKSPETVSSLLVKLVKSPEVVSSPPVKSMKSPEAVSSLLVKLVKSRETVSSLPFKPIKSPEAVSFPPVKPMKSPEAVTSPIKPLLDEPQFIATIDTEYAYLFSVSCLSEEVWTCVYDKTMKLLNLLGNLQTSIQTESGSPPRGIAVTRDGDLVYTDDNSVHLVKNKQIYTVVTLQGWGPCNICCAASGDLLVVMVSDDLKQYKVVRYSGSTETQTIQFDNQGHPLYSSGYNEKYISENRNLDICVADSVARAVVVVNQSGKFRFRYTGHSSNTEESFDLFGIATDSESHILTSDFFNNRIHILDQNGQFLCYIHNLDHPLGLCVDIRDNLFVAEEDTAQVKKIQYLSTQC